MAVLLVCDHSSSIGSSAVSDPNDANISVFQMKYPSGAQPDVSIVVVVLVAFLNR